MNAYEISCCIKQNYQLLLKLHLLDFIHYPKKLGLKLELLVWTIQPKINIKKKTGDTFTFLRNLTFEKAMHRYFIRD